MLEVVEQQQHPRVADPLRKLTLGVECGRDRGNDKLRVAEVGQSNPEDAVGIAVGKSRGDFQREPGLPRAA
jgi:hypothetical protein